MRNEHDANAILRTPIFVGRGRERRVIARGAAVRATKLESDWVRISIDGVGGVAPANYVEFRDEE